MSQRLKLGGLTLAHYSSFSLMRNNFPERASCKWRDAQRPMRNRQFIGYTLGPLERNVRRRLFDSEGGGGAVKFCLDK